MGNKCKTCKYWNGTSESDYGECLRYPPVVVTDKPDGYADVGEEPVDYLGVFPCSFLDVWCGEFAEGER